MQCDHGVIDAIMMVTACIVQKCFGELVGIGRGGGAVVLIGAMAGIVGLLDNIKPFSVPRGLGAFNLSAARMHPALCGVAIGALQVSVCGVSSWACDSFVG